VRVIIVGAGGVGAMAAWRLAKAGVEVIALEQFRLDHDRGSSYGDSRIVRRVYPDMLYTEWMADAYVLWDELQSLAPQGELMTRAGGVFFGAAQHPHLQAAQAALEASGVEHTVLDANTAMQRFPAFRLNADEIALYEPSMGYARASKCVSAAAQLARTLGANFILANPVVGLAATKGGVRVTVASGEAFEGDRLLLTAGAWTGPLLQPLGVSVPLIVTRQPYIHLEPAPESAENFQRGRFPVWIDAPANTYGFPLLGEAPGVKIGLHDHGAAVTPETVDREVREADIEAVQAYAARRFQGLTAHVVYKKVCLYTNTPDEDFLLDAIPGLPGAFVISACSGHGFKFTPLLGQVAADLVTETPVRYDLSRFRLSRF